MPAGGLALAAQGRTVQLRARRLPWAVALAASLLAFLLGAVAASADPGVGSVAATVALAALVVFTARALRMSLRVSPAGLRVRHPLRTHELDWLEIDGIRVVEVSHGIHRQRLVAFDVAGRGRLVLLDAFGEDPDELAATLRRLRERAVG